MHKTVSSSRNACTQTIGWSHKCPKHYMIVGKGIVTSLCSPAKYRMMKILTPAQPVEMF